jgi:hypothetical protein
MEIGHVDGVSRYEGGVECVNYHADAVPVLLV